MIDNSTRVSETKTLVEQTRAMIRASKQELSDTQELIEQTNELMDSALRPSRVPSGGTFPPSASLTAAMAREHGDPKTKLLHDYAAATKHYAWAVGELDRQRAVLPLEHYKEMYLVAEEARTECEQLRKAIAQLCG